MMQSSIVLISFIAVIAVIDWIQLTASIIAVFVCHRLDYLKVVSDPISPVQHLVLAKSSANRQADCQRLDHIVDFCIDKRVAITQARYLEQFEINSPTPRYCHSISLSAFSSVFLSICVHMCVYVCICAHVYMCVFMRAYVCVCVLVCVYFCACMYFGQLCHIFIYFVVVSVCLWTWTWVWMIWSWL